MMLDTVFEPEQLQHMQDLCNALLNGRLAKQLGNNKQKNSRNYAYLTLQASQWPCACQYLFPGVETHTIYQYGKPTLRDKLSRSGLDTEMIPELSELMINMEESLRRRMRGTFLLKGTSPVPGMDIPNYVVMNQYQAPHVCIGEHHDAAELFDAVSRPAVILSFNVQSDGILYFKLQHTGDVAKKLAQITQCNRPKDIRNWGYCHPVFVPANTVVVMGGWCQAALLHGTVSHSEITRFPICEQGSDADTVLRYPENKFSGARQLQDRACALVAKYKERNPGPEYVPRTVVTWRYVRVHSSHCMLSAAGQAHATPSPPLQPPGQPPPRAVLTPPQPRLGADGDAVALALAGLAQRKKAAVQQQANAGDLSHERDLTRKGTAKPAPTRPPPQPVPPPGPPPSASSSESGPGPPPPQTAAPPTAAKEEPDESASSSESEESESESAPSARRPPPRADSAQESSLTLQRQLEIARLRGLSEMWAVTGKCLMDWANNWQEILDPLNVSNSVKHISSVWDRLGFCLDEVAKITRQLRVGDDDDGNPESDILQAKAALCAELSRLNDKLRVQRANIETRLAIRGNLLDAGFVMAETVPPTVKLFVIQWLYGVSSTVPKCELLRGG